MRFRDEFPSSVSAITAEWLTATLRASGYLPVGRVISITAAAVHGGVALMSEMLHLSVDYDVDTADGPAMIIAKFPPTAEDAHQAGIDLGSFEGEAGFYRQLATRSAIHVPRCYFSRFDASTGKFLILMEDLSAARLGNVSAGCTDAEAATAIDTLARLHASWWNSDSLEAYGWLQDFDDRQTVIVGRLPEAWPAFAARFRTMLDADDFALLLEVKQRLDGSPRIIFGALRTLLHGDFKLDNLFFIPSGELVVCDWGLVMAGPPMFDVASFISLNLDVDHRRRIELDLISRYLAALEGMGIRDYDFDTALIDYSSQLTAFLPRLIAAGGLAHFSGERALAEYALGLRRVVSAVQDHGGPVLITA